MSALPVTLEDVEYAAARIAGAVVHTPCLRSETLSRIAKADVWVKFENLQFTASFKERGALNKLLQLTDEETQARRHRHVGRQPRPGRGLPRRPARHSRHHRHAVLHAQHQGRAHARPRRARRPARRHAGRGRRPRRIAWPTPSKLVFVHPYDDPRIIAGQGTIALEMLQDAPRPRHAGGAGRRRRPDRGLRRGGARAEARHQGDRRRDRRATRRCTSCWPASR